MSDELEPVVGERSEELCESGLERAETPYFYIQSPRVSEPRLRGDGTKSAG